MRSVDNILGSFEMNNFGQSISDWYGRIGIYGFWKEAHTRHINPQLSHFYDGQEAFIKQMQIFNLNFMNAPVKLLLLQSYSHYFQPVLIFCSVELFF